MIFKTARIVGNKINKINKKSKTNKMNKISKKNKINNMSEKLIDVLSEDGVLTGKKASKKEIHEKGWWHQTAHVWIYNSWGEILLQKRSMAKDSYPGLWDISVGGHVDAGESPLQAALREMSEEVGIVADEKDLKKIGVRKSAKGLSRKNYKNNEFQNVYLYKLDGQASDLRIRQEEVDEVRFVSLDDLENEIRNTETYKKYVNHGEYYFDVIKEIRKSV